jgi:hypothetical protein
MIRRWFSYDDFGCPVFGSIYAKPSFNSTFQLKQLAPILMVLLTIVPNLAIAKTLTYELQPGSMITPYDGAMPTGPSESLTGTFSWNEESSDGNIFVFNATALNFESPSFHLTLDTTLANDLATSIFVSPPKTYFGEVVDATGLYTPLEISSTEGTYEGSAASPSSISYSDLGLFPHAGGFFLAHLSFTAIQVPEPSTLILLAIGAISLLGWAWRRRAA